MCHQRCLVSTFPDFCSPNCRRSFWRWRQRDFQRLVDTPPASLAVRRGSAMYSTIESHEFAVRVNLTNSYRQFLDILYDTAEFAWLREEPDTEQLLSRLRELAGRPVEIDALPSENVYDVALAAYLLALSEKDDEKALGGARIALTAPNCWWAWKVARRMLPPAENAMIGTPEVRVLYCED